jgi:hypothetical protein
MRNFGGVPLFSAIAKSYASGRASLDGSLRAFNGREVDTAFAMERFGEALVYSGDKIPEDVFTFDKTVSGVVNGIEYTFSGFNIWTMNYYESGSSKKGPLIRAFERLGDYSIPSNTVQLYGDATWLKKSGQLDILLKNVDPSASYYALVK